MTNLKLLEKESKFLSTEFKNFFLLEFTKQLIFNSAPMEILKLKEVLAEKKQSEKFHVEREREKIKEKIHEEIKPEDEYKKSDMPKVEKFWAKPKIKRKSFPFEAFKNVRLTIPETRLPPNLRYLQPTPTEKDIDLGKLNPLIKDPFVNTIECLGNSQNIIVKGKMGEKKTRISLDEEEITEIIKKFSEESKIPYSEGVYKVVVGRLVFLAIISEVIGSKFIIKKMISSKLVQSPIRNI